MVGFDDDYLDPLTFRLRQLACVPGIFDVYSGGVGSNDCQRAGHGIADDKAISATMPDIVEF